MWGSTAVLSQGYTLFFSETVSLTFSLLKFCTIDSEISHNKYSNTIPTNPLGVLREQNQPRPARFDGDCPDGGQNSLIYYVLQTIFPYTLLNKVLVKTDGNSVGHLQKKCP